MLVILHLFVDVVPTEGGDLDSATTGTWAGKIPASLLPSVPPAPVLSPSSTTTAKSPEKSRPTSDDAATEVDTCTPSYYYRIAGKFGEH